MMKLATVARVAARSAIVRSSSVPGGSAFRIILRPLSGGSLADRAAAIERELQQGHFKAAHASDGSRGDWDKPKSKEEMEQLHNLYHKIDAMETELAALKEEVRQQQRIFAVEAPDGVSDALLQEELEEVKHIIDDAAVLEKNEEIKKKRQRKEEVKKYHGMFLVTRLFLIDKLIWTCLSHTMVPCRRPTARDPEHDW